MQRRGDNNPRGPFSDVIALRVWRSPYREDKQSQLFVDVSFKEGRLGSEPDSPVRFRLSLKRAEVRIRPDAGGVLRFVNKSVTRAEPAVGKKTVTSAKGTKASAAAGLSLRPDNASLSLDASLSGEAEFRQAIEFAQTIANMAVQTWPTPDGGYSFILTPDGDRVVLSDRPWDALSSRLVMKDPSHPRSMGEPPEPLIEICCAVEDLSIVDVEFKDRKPGFFENLERQKRVAVLQYIKQQLRDYGIGVADNTDNFAMLTLADATPQEEED